MAIPMVGSAQTDTADQEYPSDDRQHPDDLCPLEIGVDYRGGLGAAGAGNMIGIRQGVIVDVGVEDGHLQHRDKGRQRYQENGSNRAAYGGSISSISPAVLASILCHDQDGLKHEGHPADVADDANDVLETGKDDECVGEHLADTCCRGACHPRKR